ncbi:hypothetical protein EMPG_16610 [Blastomyces silverae]|uniref:Uncharacterized protein n=1 Tax=Blastomyces silverae TaxID=2060906 RepID=A0A0H1B907_9EURO|nr:hypothetical protein EMPG_16610 [Blastomyces silverae]
MVASSARNRRGTPLPSRIHPRYNNRFTIPFSPRLWRPTRGISTLSANNGPQYIFISATATTAFNAPTVPSNVRKFPRLRLLPPGRNYPLFYHTNQNPASGIYLTIAYA